MAQFTAAEIKGIDTHGFDWKLEFEDREIIVELPETRIIIEKRNFYCDRGRYGFWAESKNQEKVSIDFADGFPRYFFSLQRAFDEMNDWVEFRKLKQKQQ